MRLELIQAALEFSLDDVFKFAKDGKHLNAMPFAGIVVITDKPSNDPPHGSEGHRILVPKDAAKKYLHTLVGQGINYRPDLSGHAAQRKVGTITHAWLDGDTVKVKGVIWKKDFPEAERDLKGQRLGMSMEMAKVRVEDINADIWKLTDFTFTGATILHNQKAAYHRTALAASKDQRLSIKQQNGQAAKAALPNGGYTMPTDKKKKKAADGNVQILASAIGSQVSGALAGAMDKVNETIVKSFKSMEERLVTHIQASEEDPADKAVADLEAVLAAGKKDDDDDMDAAKGKSKKDDSDDDEDDDEEDDDDEDVDATKGKADDDDDEDDDEDLDASLETMSKSGDPDDDADDPGHMNKNSKNQGGKTSVATNTLDAGGKGMTKPFVKTKGMKANKVVHAMAAASEHISELHAEIGTMRENQSRMNKTIKRQAGVIKKMEAQADRFAERIDRQTLPAEATALLTKSGYSASSLQAEGKKLSVAVVDQIIAEGAPSLHPREKMQFKNLFLQYGLMEDGAIDRGFRSN